MGCGGLRRFPGRGKPSGGLENEWAWEDPEETGMGDLDLGPLIDALEVIVILLFSLLYLENQALGCKENMSLEV